MDNLINNITDEARSWIPTPYIHQRMNKGIGCSCALFIVGVFSNLGLLPKEIPPHFQEDWAFHNPDSRMPKWFEDILANNFKEIKLEELKVGDLILYQFGVHYALSHISILVENNMIVHSEKPIGVKLTNRYDSKWFKRERIYFTYVR